MAMTFQARAIITAHAKVQHLWLSPGPWPYYKCSKLETVEVRSL